MRRGGSTTMITTARRCRGRLAPLLAFLTTTAATPVDYAADHIVFAHLRTILRAETRWPGIAESGGIPPGADKRTVRVGNASIHECYDCGIRAEDNTVVVQYFHLWL